MEFTVRITEQDYLDAYRLQRRSKWRMIGKFLAYASCALVWTIIGGSFLIQHFRSQDPERIDQAFAMRENFMPMSLFLTAYVLLTAIGIPWLLKRQFRKNRNLNADFFNQITAEGITQKSSQGSSSQTLWNAFKSWRESERVFILEFPSGLYLLLPKSGISIAGDCRRVSPSALTS